MEELKMKRKMVYVVALVLALTLVPIFATAGGRKGDFPKNAIPRVNLRSGSQETRDPEFVRVDLTDFLYSVLAR